MGESRTVDDMVCELWRAIEGGHCYSYLRPLLAVVLWRGLSHGVHIWVPRLPCPRQGVSCPSNIRLCTTRSLQRTGPESPNRAPTAVEPYLHGTHPSPFKTSSITLRSLIRNIPSHPSHHLFRWPRPAPPPKRPRSSLYLLSFIFLRMALRSFVIARHSALHLHTPARFPSMCCTAVNCAYCY